MALLMLRIKNHLKLFKKNSTSLVPTYLLIGN